MASLLLGTLKTLGGALLGDLAKEGIQTVGQIAKAKLGQVKRDVTGKISQKDKQLYQMLKKQVDTNTNDIRQIKQQMEIEQ